jgi:hypothetical protein
MIVPTGAKRKLHPKSLVKASVRLIHAYTHDVNVNAIMTSFSRATLDLPSFLFLPYLFTHCEKLTTCIIDSLVAFFMRP